MLTPTKAMKMAKVAREQPYLVLDMLKAGLLDASLRPMIAKGSEKYLRAIEAGDIASGADEVTRALACWTCSARRNVTSPKSATGWVYEWCGIPLHELVSGEKARGHPVVLAERGWRNNNWDGVEGPTCGCLLPLKRMVASEFCPKGEWGAVKPVMLTVGVSG